MVVLNGLNMLTSGSSQYLQPDYLSPLPTTLDAKKSPLALLAQTCSQIGAETNSKPIIPPIEKPKKDMESREISSPVSEKPAFKPFKPYQNDCERSEEKEKEKPGFRTPTSKSSTPNTSTASPVTVATRETKSPVITESAVKSDTISTPTVTSPVIRSGLEMLQGHPKDIPLGTYKPSALSSGLAGLSGLNAVSSACCPPGLDSLSASNPAFRPPLPSLAAHGLPGFPSTTVASGPNPYVGYARVKTATGGDTLVLVCRDPYCTGCQPSMHNAQLLNGSCPSGCTQCDHQKLGLGSLPGTSLTGLLPGLNPPVSTASPLSYSQHSLMGAQRPYVCNWIAGDAYCGKRFGTSEELLQHLRTHTNLSASDSAVLSMLHPGLGPHHSLLTSPAGLHRAYPTTPLSPLSAAAARYHPYSKSALPVTLPGIPSSPFSPLPPPHPAVGPYYSMPYSLYGQRIGAAVHP